MTERDHNSSGDTSSVAGYSGQPLVEVDPAFRPPRRFYVRLALLAAVLLTLITAGMLGWRWYQDRFPNAVLVATGDQTADGVEVVVKTEDGREVARGRLSAQNEYQFAVLVEQGYHLVRATLHDQTFLEQRVFVPNARLLQVKIEVPPALQQMMPATAPSPPPPRPATPPLSARRQLQPQLD